MSMVMGGGRHARSRAPRDVRGPVLATVVGAFEFVVAWVATSSIAATISISAAVLLLAACFVWPFAIMVAAFPASFATWRVGPAAIDISAADLIAFLGAVAALPFVPWHGRAFRSVLLAMAGYSAVVAVAVVAHPSSTAAIEVVHRFVMVMGAVCIGAAIVRTRHVTAALRSLVIVAAIFSVAAVVDTLSHGLRPAYAFGVQKNAAGSLLIVSFLVVFFGHGSLRWSRRATITFGTILLIGLAATQSRGAVLALVAVFAVYVARMSWHGRAAQLAKFAPVILVVGVALITAATLSFQSQRATHTGNNAKFGSIGSRETTFSVAWSKVIKPHPILGAGPKWFTRPDAPSGEPHNLLIDELSSTGAFGLAAFLLLLAAILKIVRQIDHPLADLAWYAVLARLLAAMVDVYWVAGPNTLPFLVLGLAIGADAIDRNSRHDLVAGGTR